MSLLNNTAYKVEKDNLIYDSKHPVDVDNIVIKIAAEEAGEIRRGQLIDYANGEYSVHAMGGEASCIAAETTSYAADDTEIIVPCYISGTFNTRAVTANPEVTAADVEALRSKNIYLK